MGLGKWKRRLSRAWRSLKGESWAYVQLYCYQCKGKLEIEVREEWHHPLVSRCNCTNDKNLASWGWNDAPVFPIPSRKESVWLVQEAKTGDHLTIPEVEELERQLGYGEHWYQKNTVKAMQDRYAMRKEHEVLEDEGVEE